MAETVTLKTPDGAMPTFIAASDTSSLGAVLVFHESFGVTDHIKDICSRLANAGWIAAAPSLFHRAGSPVFGYDNPAPTQVMETVTGSGLLDDVDAALYHFEELGITLNRVAVVGFCMGGSISCFVASRYSLGAAVSFYGGGIAYERFSWVPSWLTLAPQLQTPWLGLYGDLDQSISVEDVEALRKAAQRSAVATDLFRYPEAGHGFHCDTRVSYHAASARDAWGRMLAWLSTRTSSA